MPDLKISQLTGGGAAQATDEIPIARSGANFKITGANIAAAATTIGASVTQSGSALVNQADIGSAPNEIPLNQYLGTMAYQDAAGVNIASASVDVLTVSGDLTVDTNTLYVDSVNNRVGIGTTSLSSKLEVQGQSVMARFKTGAATDGRIEFAYNTTDVGYLSVDSATEFSVVARIGNVLKLGANGSERARITSGGYFKASNTGTYAGSTGAYHEFRSDANNAVLYLSNTNAAYTNDLVFVDTTTAAGTGFDFFDVRANNVGQFRVRGDGTIFAQNTTVQSISDARLKENVVDAIDGLDVITALRPVRYDWKAGYGNDRTNQLGFIAQEVEAVFPEAVSEWSMDEPTGEVDEDGKPITEKVDYKTVGPGALIPVLVKAIQQLEARIAALES